MHRLKFTFLAAAASAALLTAGCTKGGGEAAQPDTNVGADKDWPAVNGDPAETGYSRLDAIDTGNAGQLGLAWSFDLPGEVTLEGTPLEVGGTLFVTGSYASVYAVDAASGKLLWKYDPETWKHNPALMHFSFGANRGVAYENGKVFVASLDGRLIALDAKTGKQLWVAETIPAGVNAIVTGAPRVMNGKIIIGNGGADFGTRGYVTAYDSNTGKQLWRFYVAPGSPEQNKGDPAMEAAAKTWVGDFWKKTGGGGGPWNAITYDAEFNQVYVATGNAAPYDQGMRGKGANLYTASIVALDANTGKYVWHYQPVPADSWDYDNTSQMTLADLNIDGKLRKVLMEAPKNGFFYVLDRKTGKLVNAPGKTTLVTWAKGIDLKTGEPIEAPNIRYQNGAAEIWPGSVGGHDWQAMSYNPKLGRVFIPIQQIGARFSLGGETTDAAFNVMGVKAEPIIKRPGDGKGSLVAWDPVTQKEVWRVHHDTLWNGGTLATAGGLVFQGTGDGWFNAYDGSNGNRLWRFNAGIGIVGAPMTYSLDGKQYVAILAGYGGTTAAYGKFMDVGWKFGQQPRRLLVFALDGKAQLPASPPPDFKVHAVDDPKLVIDPKDVVAGRALSIQCAACHGVGFYATGTPAPDLRESQLALDPKSFRQVVKDGALLSQGMPQFQNLSDEQLRQIWVYIRQRARDAMGGVSGGEAAAPAPKP
jgi:quinohemoprotein ethanol dehydrogenase